MVATIPFVGVYTHMSRKVNKSKLKVRGGAGRVFYKNVNWAEWWDEFCFSIEKNGEPKYRTAWAFAKAKGKNNQEASWIYQSIGPEPQKGDAKTLAVPHQGDWLLRREKGFWFDPDGSKKEILKAAIQQKADSLETLRQLAVVPAKMIDLYQNIANRILAHYNGAPMLPGMKEEENFRRAQNLLRLINACKNGVSDSIDDLAKCLGLHPGAPDKWADLAVISAEQGAKAALAGQQQGLKQGAEVTQAYVGTLTSMVHMALQKSKAFDLPLPEDNTVSNNGKQGAPVVHSNGH